MAIAIAAAVGYFEYRRWRFEEAFRRSDHWAIDEVAAKGQAVVPKMLDGLRGADPGIREASRHVLYCLWGELSAEQRKAASIDQFKIDLWSR